MKRKWPVYFTYFQEKAKSVEFVFVKRNYVQPIAQDFVYADSLDLYLRIVLLTLFNLII